MGSSWDVNSGGGAESGEPAQERGGGARAESAVGRARSIKEQLESLSEISAPVVRLVSRLVLQCSGSVERACTLVHGCGTAAAASGEHALRALGRAVRDPCRQARLGAAVRRARKEVVKSRQTFQRSVEAIGRGGSGWMGARLERALRVVAAQAHAACVQADVLMRSVCVVSRSLCAQAGRVGWLGAQRCVQEGQRLLRGCGSTFAGIRRRVRWAVQQLRGVLVRSGWWAGVRRCVGKASVVSVAQKKATDDSVGARVRVAAALGHVAVAVAGELVAAGALVARELGGRGGWQR